MITKYIHIGYPKNLSTSLQRDFFGKHPQLMHLGVGHGDHNLGYIDPSISLAVEFYLRYAKDIIYAPQETKIKSLFATYFEKAENDPFIKAVGISGEHMGFNFTPDNIDISQKADRLHRIFGDDTKIIMIIRNQTDLIKSLYNECIRVGYPKSYRDYIEYIYMFHERNFASDFFYGDSFELYKSLFGADNICVIPIETIRAKGKLIKGTDGKTLILKHLSNHLGISYPSQELGHYNGSLNESTLVKTRQLNAEFPHDLGNIIFGSAESHRIMARFEDDLKISPPKEASGDVLTKRQVIGKAIDEAKKEPDLTVNYDCSAEHLARLEDLYKVTNNKLAIATGLNLSELGYPL